MSRYPNSSLFIYNRWGNQVYQSKNYQNEWDGHGLSEGTYYYILKLRAADGGERSYKGWIELMR
ncbi:gliding motility-associated C-terminal domain-containing protein [Chitinophaga sp. G-6-1-13]|uniref:Gliding motility-associated C-terminal domain-containing protein n=1 Tax=Chitinophaga fulva TaxID=2728842 RepID=A0A848GAN4_9BACT|nr:gliding motility-associated C-terminal domain-containing protein [Chitinophaga fulva]